MFSPLLCEQGTGFVRSPGKGGSTMNEPNCESSLSWGTLVCRYETTRRTAGQVERPTEREMIRTEVPVLAGHRGTV